jgi:hypothetical protein
MTVESWAAEFYKISEDISESQLQLSIKKPRLSQGEPEPFFPANS